MKLLLIQNSSGETNFPMQNHCTLHIVHCTLEEARGGHEAAFDTKLKRVNQLPCAESLHIAHCTLYIEKGVKI